MIAVPFAAVVLGLLWLMDRRDKRHQADRVLLLEAAHAERAVMFQRMHDERAVMENVRAAASPDLAALVALVDRLCQRVQAPEQAVHEHAVASAPDSPEPVSMFNDEQYWESREQLAERAMSEELDVGVS